jgi:hypothetical protein
MIFFPRERRIIYASLFGKALKPYDLGFCIYDFVRLNNITNFNTDMPLFNFTGSFYKVLLLAILMGWTASCSEYLEEDLSTIMTPSTIYSDDEGLLKALTGAYMPMSYTWNTGYANTHTVGVLMGSDDLTTASYTARAEYKEFDRYNVNDWNNGLRFIWNGAYKSIQGRIASLPIIIM